MRSVDKKSLVIRLSEHRLLFVGVHEGFDFVDYELAADGTVSVYQCRASDGARLFDSTYPTTDVAHFTSDDDRIEELLRGQPFELDN